MGRARSARSRASRSSCRSASAATGSIGSLRLHDLEHQREVVEETEEVGDRRCIAVDGDELTIRGGAQLTGSLTEALDDHRLAMTFGIAGLIASGETRVRRAGSASVSYPGFFAELERVRA